MSMWDADNLLAQAHAAREAGADVVVVHVHWGTEYSRAPDAAQVELARQLTASPDVDLVLGEHAHVVQPITRVNGKWVVTGWATWSPRTTCRSRPPTRASRSTSTSRNDPTAGGG